MLTKTILELAGGQHGVVGSAQLTADLGVSSSRISRARRAGLLVDMTSRVLRVASSPETVESRCMAVQLQATGIGFLSGPTAARLHGFRKMPASPVHFTVPDRRRLNVPAWAEVHFTSWYDADDDRMTLPNGLIVATPLRTLFGLAAAFNQFRFRRAAEDAWHLGLVSPIEAAEYLERHRCRGKDGVLVMERWLDHALDQARPAQSDLERRLLDAFEHIGLPRPTRQHPLTLPNGERIHLDIAWPNVLLAVEPGASWWHGGDLAQRKDQDRDLAAGELGWQIIRLDESLARDPLAVARRVRRLYEARATHPPHVSSRETVR